MRIGIDCNSLFGEKRGIGWYLYHLLEKYSYLSDGDDSFFLFWFSNKGKISEIPPLLREKREVIGKKLSSLPRPAGLYFSKICHSFPGKFLPNLDVVHFPNFTAFPTKNAKIIVTVHDLVFRLFPGTIDFKVKFSLIPFFLKSLEISHRIIAVSKSTERDLLNLFPQIRGKVRVIYQGVDHDFFRPKPFPDEKMSSILGTPDYILSLSTFEPRKNLITLLKAFSDIVEERGNRVPDLVLAGPMGWKMGNFKEELRQIPQKVKEKIKIPGYLPRELLPEIYSNCRVFVFPSLYEGFGLPVLEAMACGAPVVVSKTSSLPEVGGDAAVYVDPLDPEGFKKEILEILDSPSKAERLREKSLEQSKKFSWEKTARETLALYKEALNCP